MKPQLATQLQSTNFISVTDSISKIDSNAIFVDGSWFLSKDRNAREEYEKGPRIKGAYYFDIDDVALKGSELNPKNLPHIMPPKAMFSKVMDAFSVMPTSTIVIYATKDCPFIARAFYTFKTLCQPTNQIYLMQGSLQEWIDAGGPVDVEKKQSLRELDLESNNEGYEALDDENSITMNKMLDLVSNTTADSDSVIIDARSAARFRAEVPEPRPGLRLGHMPGAFNVPFNELLQSDDMTKFKSPAEMRQIFHQAGVDIDTDKKIIVSCGSGVTACVLAVGLMECGRDAKNTFLYDGSWIEWVSKIRLDSIMSTYYYYYIIYI